MPRKKASRAPSRARVNKLQISLDDDDPGRKEDLIKRLEDFDQQVNSIILQMEEDKEATLASIREFYFRDEQLCEASTNAMPWLEYLNKQNIPVPHARQSINKLISLAESQPATVKRKRQKRIPTVPVPPFNETPQLEVKTRGRSKRNVLGTSQTDNLEPPRTATRSSSRGRKMDQMSTPLNLQPPVGNFVTPKFDPHTPLNRLDCLRTPRVGEIAMSLRGSPLQVGAKEILASLMTDDAQMDIDTKNELLEFHEKLGKLLI